MSNISEEKNISVTVESDYDAGERLDKVLAGNLMGDYSRARLQGLIKEGAVTVNGVTEKKGSTKMEMQDVIEVVIPPVKSATPQPQDIPLDIVYEDDDLLVINKQAGLVVHPGAGNHDGTLVNALLHHCGDSLSGIGGVSRPGIVHRLDKETSGLMIVAKHDKAHQGMSEQLADRSLSRVYHAIVLKAPMPPVGKIDMAIARDPHNRLKMTTRIRGGGRAAVTHYKLLRNFKDCFSLVECRLESGRTHQIRVHMQALGHPLLGDAVYGGQATQTQALVKRLDAAAGVAKAVLSFPRQALHAKEINFVHPVSGDNMRFESDYADDFRRMLDVFNHCK